MTDLERRIKAKLPGEDTGIEIRRSMCDICSPGMHCGIAAYVKDGRVIKIEGLVIANMLVALAGAVMAQKNRVFEITMGTGSMVFGLAAVIIGVNIFKNRQKVNSSTAAIVGSIIYKACVAFALSMGLMPQDLKLITAVLFLIILVVSGMKKKKVKFDA